ncbi:MAG: sugar phosphate isomerase/epimerase [Phycisphaerales bacterium]|nr:MAG: sugar phosphate isomerase/epimerase [Phycisphaerales bacterium]
MSNIDRRVFLGRSFAAATVLGVGSDSFDLIRQERDEARRGDTVANARRRNRIAVSTYSFWRFKRNVRMPVETCIESAAEMGFDAVEVLHRQMDGDSNAYLQSLKRRALVNGIDLCCLSIHQGFLKPDKAVRQKNIEHTLKCIDLAYKLGIPVMRLNTGTWGTSRSFDELMANRGIERPVAGYTEEDGFKWVIESIERCLPGAEKAGVVLALENHWGLARTPEGLLRIVDSVDSPWLQVLLDTGNFLEDPYDKLDKCAPRTVYVHAKAYFGGGIWYTLELDYPRIAAIMREHHYRGYVSLEFEGNEDYKTAIPKGLAMLRSAFG